MALAAFRLPASQAPRQNPLAESDGLPGAFATKRAGLWPALSDNILPCQSIQVLILQHRKKSTFRVRLKELEVQRDPSIPPVYHKEVLLKSHFPCLSYLLFVPFAIYACQFRFSYHRQSTEGLTVIHPSIFKPLMLFSVMGFSQYI